MSDEPSVPRRKKSRRNLRRITVPGDEVPRGSALEEDVDLDDDDLPVDDEGSEEEDDSGFEDEPTDPSVFDKERGSGQRAAVESRASFVPQEGSSFRNEGVVVSRSRIISDRPAPSVLLPPPTLPPYPSLDVDEPALEQVSINADEDDEEESRPTLHAEPPSAPVRSKTPPPPPPGQSIMIASDYAQEVDDLRLRREAEDLLPPSLRPSAVSSPPIPAARLSKAPKPASLAPPRDPVTPAITASNPPQPARPSSTGFPEHTTGPRVSAAPAVPVDARSVASRAKPETSAKPNPPAPPRKILTPVPPSANKPPPPPPKEPGAKRPPAWWKTFFSDDYLRSVLPLTPAQVRRQCDFLEAVLGLPRGATILDVGCGTGLQAIEMTERGYLVVGLDLSLPMITRAAEEAQYRNLRINFLHTDIREIQFEGAFDAVVCLGTTFGFFDDDSNRNVLGRLRDALKPGGRLLLDVVNRDYVIRAQPNLVWFQGDGCVCMEESDFNYFTSRLHVKRTMMHEDGRQSDAEYSIRLYSLHEIGQLLNPLGFRVIEVSGQHATRGVFFGTDSSQIIALAERRLPKGDVDGGKAESRASGQKPSLRPVPPVAKAEQVVAKKDRDSSDDLTELVEEESAPRVGANAFDDEEATDPNVRMPEPSGPSDE